MTSQGEENEKNMKLSQMKNILNNKNTTADHVQQFLRTDYDINSSISSTLHLKLKQPELIGCTALHLAFMENHIEGFKVLIEGIEKEGVPIAGADFTIKNKDGLTVLHQVLENCYKNESMHRLKSEYARLILSKHLRNKNYKNPCTKYGLSHFHAACLCNNAELVKMFLENGVSPNECVEKDAPLFPGYSPLHFAVKSYAFESVQVLLEKGANQHLENAEGMTPMLMLIEQKIRIQNSTAVDTIVSSDSLENVLEDREKILQLLYQHNSYNGVKISAFHLACIMKDSSLLETMLKISNDSVNFNFAVDQNSSLWPGFTGLHFAALCNFDNLMLLLEKEANIEMKNAAGLTAFDLCLNKYKAEQIHKILSSVNMWKDIVLSDGETTLLELVDAMQSSDHLQTFLETSDARIKIFVPMNSVLWPGFTILHLAVQLFISNLEMVNTCLNAGANVKVKCANGLSPLHLAFRQEKKDVVAILLQHCTDTLDFTDNENLSHLHIACATPDNTSYQDFLNNLLRTGVNVNVAYRGKPIGAYLRTGFTPLHVAVVSGNDELVRALLECGGDRYATDSDGFTPVHWVLGAPNPDEVGAELLLSDEEIREFTVSGLSHLHVVSYVKEIQSVKDFEIVRCLLTMAEPNNTNVAVEYNENSSPPFVSKIVGMTPLFMAIQRKNWQTAGILTPYCADVFAKQPNGSILFYDALNLSDKSYQVHFFTSILKNNDEVRRRVKEETGLTMLHLDCYEGYPNEVESALKKEQNLNAQIHKDSPIWPGYTPLHILVRYNVNPCFLKKFNLDLDTTLQNADGETAVHLAYKNLYEKENEKGIMWFNNLIKHLDYNVNPVNNDGLSHFHIACSVNYPHVVEKFLETQVNVNQSTDAFSEMNGQSPLHLILSSERVIKDEDVYIELFLKTVDLLLKNGARVNAKDAVGETPLHKIFRHDIRNFDIFETVIEAGADVKAIDIFGRTALELSLCNGDFLAEHLETFVKRGCRLNTFTSIDRKGYVSLIFCKSRGKESEEKRIVFNTMLRYRHTADTDDEGRTIIHNLASNSDFSLSCEYYTELIDQLVTITRCSCDIDDQDKQGKTALHYAASFGNEVALQGLLNAGADINITDNEGKSAFYYLNKHNNSDIDFIAMQVKKLELLHCHVSQENKKLADDIIRQNDVDIEYLEEEVTIDLEQAKNVETGFPSVSLYNFLYEPSAKTIRALMGNQTLFENFFRDFDDEIFEELFTVHKLLYRKALARGKLMDKASVALNRLSKCSLLCAELIVGFVTSVDLENVVKAMRGIADD